MEYACPQLRKCVLLAAYACVCTCLYIFYANLKLCLHMSAKPCEHLFCRHFFLSNISDPVYAPSHSRTHTPTHPVSSARQIVAGDFCNLVCGIFFRKVYTYYTLYGINCYKQPVIFARFELCTRVMPPAIGFTPTRAHAQCLTLMRGKNSQSLKWIISHWSIILLKNWLEFFYVNAKQEV